MKSYTVFLLQNTHSGFIEEARIDVLHLVPPQFKLGAKTLLTEEQAKAVLAMAIKGVADERLRCDLVKFEPAPPPAPLEEGA